MSGERLSPVPSVIKGRQIIPGLTIGLDGTIGMPNGEIKTPYEILRQQIINKEFPLSSDVPFNRGNLPAKSVAIHELKHLKLALHENVPVALLSVKKEGDSLGRTVLAHSVGREKLALIAAGGRVDGHGAGSDTAKMFYSYLSPNSDGGFTNRNINSAWAAVHATTQRAEAILGPENEIDDIEAEIIAYKEEIDMGLYVQIHERALFEHKVKKFGLSDLLNDVTSGIVRKENIINLKEGNYYIISNIGLDISVTEEYIGGKLTKWECNCCHSRDGNHSPACLVNNEKWKDEYKNNIGRPFNWRNPFEENEIPEPEDEIEKNGDIFVRV